MLTQTSPVTTLFANSGVREYGPTVRASYPIERMNIDSLLNVMRFLDGREAPFCLITNRYFARLGMRQLWRRLCESLSGNNDRCDPTYFLIHDPSKADWRIGRAWSRRYGQLCSGTEAWKKIREIAKFGFFDFMIPLPNNGLARLWDYSNAIFRPTSGEPYRHLNHNEETIHELKVLPSGYMVPATSADRKIRIFSPEGLLLFMETLSEVGAYGGSLDDLPVFVILDHLCIQILAV